MRGAALALLALVGCSSPEAWRYEAGGTFYGPFVSREACESMRAWSATQAYNVSPCFTERGRPADGISGR